MSLFSQIEVKIQVINAKLRLSLLSELVKQDASPPICDSSQESNLTNTDTRKKFYTN